MIRNRYDVDEVLERHIDFKKLKRIGKYIKPHTKKMLFALLLVVASSLLSLTVPTILQTVIDEVIPAKNIARLVKLSIFAASAIIFSSLLATLRNVIMAHVGQSVIYNIRRDLFAHLQDLPFTYYDSRPHGKILVRVVNYVNAVSNVMTNGLLTAIVDLFNIFFIAFFMFSMDRRLALYVLAGLPVLLIFTAILKRFQKKFNMLQSNKSSNLTAYTCEAIAGVKVTQIFNRQNENTKIYKRLNDAYHRAWMRMAITSNMLSPVTELLKQCAVGLVYVAGAVWISGDMVAAIEVGVLIAMGTYAARFWQPFISLANIYTNFITTLTYLERIFQTLDEPVEIESREGAHLLESIKG
ncbi:MAG: ABC transporter ATP-binding protein, partial [Clostridia bacterium]|nr:ABC transporter ATP-binding protein [Clostridia bacterium]